MVVDVEMIDGRMDGASIAKTRQRQFDDESDAPYVARCVLSQLILAGIDEVCSSSVLWARVRSVDRVSVPRG